LVQFDALMPEIMRLMFTHPGSTVRALRMLMHLSSSSSTWLCYGGFQPPEYFPQSDF